MMKFRSNPLERREAQFLKQIILITLACIIAYLWIDRPLALLMLHLHPKANVLGNTDITTQITSIAYFAVLITMVFYAYMRVVKREKKNKYLVAAAGGISLAVPIAFFIKTELQYVLGRVPPRYINSDALLFVRRPDLYGFHLFQGGSFPSGHMCVFTAALLIISFYYPKLKALSIFTLMVLASLLIFYNYHFLSDVIAGTYLGYLVAKVIYSLSVKGSSL